MKTLITLFLFAIVSPLALADDAADKASDTVDTSKNPITGSVTVTKKHKKLVKHGKDQAKLEATEKTTTKKSGEVDKKVEVKGDSTDKPAETK